MDTELPEQGPRRGGIRPIPRFAARSVIARSGEATTADASLDLEVQESSDGTTWCAVGSMALPPSTDAAQSVRFERAWMRVAARPAGGSSPPLALAAGGFVARG